MPRVEIVRFICNGAINATAESSTIRIQHAIVPRVRNLVVKASHPDNRSNAWLAEQIEPTCLTASSRLVTAFGKGCPEVSLASGEKAYHDVAHLSFGTFPF
jgi:hypothetical protein